jgi:hypothetical protein
MKDRKVAAAARVSAASAILDRGWGRPRQPVDADVNVVSPEVQERRERARRAMFELLKRAEKGDFSQLTLEHEQAGGADRALPTKLNGSPKL